MRGGPRLQDGDRNFVILSNHDDLYLFRNDLTGTDVNWLQIDLDRSAETRHWLLTVGVRISL